MRRHDLFLIFIAGALCIHLSDSFVIRSNQRRTHAPSATIWPGGKAAAAQSPTAIGSYNAAIPRSGSLSDKAVAKIESRLFKNLRQVCQKYDMVEEDDHIMVCVSGGKDSATLLHLLLKLQLRLCRSGGREASETNGGTNFRITAVHLNQVQPGYDGSTMYEWLDTVGVPYKIITEDTYSIVKEKTPENKTYCSLCSRLRRGILYTVAHQIGATKIALGHHADDAIETLLLNAIHSGQLKSMPARYYSSDRDMHVIRPLVSCLEDDIRQYATAKNFPILPCNLCGSQPDAHRAKVKLLCNTLDALNPNARQNMVSAMGDVRPSHLLDMGLREACGLDSKTGQVVDAERAHSIRGFHIAPDSDGGSVNCDGSDALGTVDRQGDIPNTFIENLL